MLSVLCLCSGLVIRASSQGQMTDLISLKEDGEEGENEKMTVTGSVLQWRRGREREMKPIKLLFQQLQPLSLTRLPWPQALLTPCH